MESLFPLRRDVSQAPVSDTPSPFAARVKLAMRTLDVAIAAVNPTHVLALFSGGGDSTVAAHVAARHPRFGGAVFIDTGTSLPGVVEHAHAVAATQGWELAIARSPQSYEDMIREHGLPGPGMHPTAYVRLKEKALDAHVRDLCSRCQTGERHNKHDTVMWVSGARSSESVRRMGHSGWMVVDGSQVWVNPILDWDNSECRAYRDLCGLPTSDVAALIHRSGECNCGTYASKGEREMLTAFFPEFAKQIDAWEKLARDHGHDHAAVWGEAPKKRTSGIESGIVALFGDEEEEEDQNLEHPRCGALACSDCAAKAAGA